MPSDELRRTSPPAFRRHLGLAALIVYGIGDMLGGGIYALTGKLAGVAESLSWLSFALAAAVAAPPASVVSAAVLVVIGFGLALLWLRGK